MKVNVALVMTGSGNMASGSLSRTQVSCAEPTNRLITAVSSAARKALMERVRPCTFKTGDVLYEPGALISDAFFPLSCVISLVAVMSDGKSTEVCIFGCEGVVAYASAQVSRRAFGRYVVQIGGSALKIAINELRLIVRHHKDLREVLRRYSEALLLQTFQTIACNTFHSVEARCCRLILTTDDRTGRRELPLTHEFLADMLGTQRSTVSIIMKRLAAEGVLRQQRGRICILNKLQLQRNACECYSKIKSDYVRLLPKTSPA
jgi:CRP-like cAMP-binding protein